MASGGSKPMGYKAYGSIGHMVGSRRGNNDHGITDGMQRICTEKARDKRDFISVTAKLDGSCCAVYRHPDTDDIMALTRAGWPATTSPFVQHHMFAEYVRGHADAFRSILLPGERAVGEWMAQAHGTRYELGKDVEPLVLFDVMREHTRIETEALMARLVDSIFTLPPLLHCGGPLPVSEALERLNEYGKWGAIDPPEGVVYRVERNGKVDFLAKYVYPEKVDGCYLPEISGGDAVWNWRLPNWG